MRLLSYQYSISQGPVKFILRVAFFLFEGSSLTLMHPFRTDTCWVFHSIVRADTWLGFYVPFNGERATSEPPTGIAPVLKRALVATVESYPHRHDNILLNLVLLYSVLYFCQEKKYSFLCVSELWYNFRSYFFGGIMKAKIMTGTSSTIIIHPEQTKRLLSIGLENEESLPTPLWAWCLISFVTGLCVALVEWAKWTS